MNFRMIIDIYFSNNYYTTLNRYFKEGGCGETDVRGKRKG